MGRVILQDFISRGEVGNNPERIYVFGFLTVKIR